MGRHVEARGCVLRAHALLVHACLDTPPSLPGASGPTRHHRRTHAQVESAALKAQSATKSAPFVRQLTALYTAATLDAAQRADKIGARALVPAARMLCLQRARCACCALAPMHAGPNAHWPDCTWHARALAPMRAGPTARARTGPNMCVHTRAHVPAPRRPQARRAALRSLRRPRTRRPRARGARRPGGTRVVGSQRWLGRAADGGISDKGKSCGVGGARCG